MKTKTTLLLPLVLLVACEPKAPVNTASDSAEEGDYKMAADIPDYRANRARRAAEDWLRIIKSSAWATKSEWKTRDDLKGATGAGTAAAATVDYTEAKAAASESWSESYKAETEVKEAVAVPGFSGPDYLAILGSFNKELRNAMLRDKAQFERLAAMDLDEVIQRD